MSQTAKQQFIDAMAKEGVEITSITITDQEHELCYTCHINLKNPEQGSLLREENLSPENFKLRGAMFTELCRELSARQAPLKIA